MSNYTLKFEGGGHYKEAHNAVVSKEYSMLLEANDGAYAAMGSLTNEQVKELLQKKDVDVRDECGKKCVVLGENDYEKYENGYKRAMDDYISDNQKPVVYMDGILKDKEFQGHLSEENYAKALEKDEKREKKRREKLRIIRENKR